MPSKDKVSLSQLKVGILGIVALTCVALLVFLLTGNMSFFKKEIPLHAYTSDAAGLTAGSPVRVNGIQAGKVTKVALSGETNPQRIIKVDFSVNEDMQKEIPVDSVVAISSDNLLGSTKFLGIAKGTATSFVQPDSTMKSADTRQFDALIQQGYGVLDSLQAILGKVQDIVGQVEVGKGTIGKLLVDETLYNSLQATVNQVQQLSSTLNSRHGTIGHLINDDALYVQVQSIANKIDGIIQNLQEGKGSAGLLLNDSKLYKDLDQSVTQLNAMLTDLNAGKGTAGQLLKSDKIANQLNATLMKVDGTIDKINSGQGTIGQLMVNPALYDSLNGATRDTDELVKAIRTEPKKYLRIQLHIF